MASFHVRSVRCFTTSSRLLRKINIQRPNVPSTERRVLEAVTVPIYPPDLRPLPELCLEEQKKREANSTTELRKAYWAFRLNQAIKLFNENKMVAICHYLPMDQRGLLALQTKLKQADLKITFINNNIAVKAVTGSKFENLMPFLTSTTAYIISEDVKVVELVKLLKKISEVHLLGGIVEGRILSRDGMMEMAKLPPLDTMRGELLTILKASASKTSRLLGSHQQELSRCLQELSKPTSGDGSSISSPDGAEGR